MNKYVQLAVFTAFLIFHTLSGQTRQEINIPDIPGYKVLKCDLHMHTVFSDGRVWPSIRVYEAWRDGLDAIAITDHINYKLFWQNVDSESENTPYLEALPTAKKLGIILINGTEINRQMPPGHINALFIQDADKLLADNIEEALAESKKQGAYIQWNHPGYSQKKPPVWFDIHQHLWEKGLLDGIEIYNHHNYFPEALEWATEKDLTITASSDVHYLVDMTHPEKYHRPVTLVFASDRSSDAIREALFDQRSAVYYGNTIIGKEQFLAEIFNASIEIVDVPMVIENKDRLILIKNTSDVDYELVLSEPVEGLRVEDKYTVYANRTSILKIKMLSESVINAPGINIGFQVMNLITGPDSHLHVDLVISRNEPVEIIEYDPIKNY